jgi:glycosyltransferase involved in cell wall biosynthesis
MRPSITVIIPAFNAETTIGAAISSVLNQTDKPDELIVVDDGSTDKTTDMVCEFGNDVRLIHQENQGAGAARQTGTAAAISDYIAYLDADDWWPETKISKYREIVETEPIDFLLSDFKRAIHGESQNVLLPLNSTFFPRAVQFIKRNSIHSDVQNLYKLESKDGLTLLLNGFPVFPSTVLVKRMVIKEFGGWRAYRRSQDFDIGLRICRGRPLHYLDEMQAIIGLHAGNDNEYDYVVKQTEGDIKVLTDHFQKETSESYRRQISRALSRKYCSLGYAHRINGCYSSARLNYAQGLKWKGKKIHAFLRWVYLLTK